MSIFPDAVKISRYSILQTKNIVFLLFFMYIFTFGNEIVLAESGKRSKSSFLSRKETKVYASFCTGYYLMLEHRWEEAIESFEKALESNQHAEKIHNFLATCYFQLNKKDEALFHIEEVARLKPDDFGIHYTLGSIYESEGEVKKAVYEYERAGDCIMKDIEKVFVADMLHRLANLYLENGDFEKATNTYRKILDSKLASEPAKIHHKLGQICLEQKRVEEALKEFVKARECDSSLEPISFYLAVCYEELEDYDNAIAELKSFIERNPDAWFMRISMSNICEKVQQFEIAEFEREKAFEILKKNVGDGSTNLREYIVLSQMFHKKGKNRQAIEILQTAVSNVTNVNNENNELLKEIHLLMANVYYEMNEYKNVVKVLRKVLQIDPDCHQASNFLGYLFVERNEKLDEALSLIQKALSLEPKNGAYLDSLGWAYYKLATEHDSKKIMIALQMLVEASKYAEDPEIVEHIGDVYYSLGFWEEAQKRWETALKQWEKATEGLPPHLIHKTGRELKAVRIIQKKLEKLQGLEVMEDLVEKLESGDKLVSSQIQ
jgi:tetratricopeptide (TPR) repeat protein